MTRIAVSERCYATTKAEPLEDRVWAVVKRMLENPKLVAAEVGLKHASNDEKRAELRMEIEARDRALAECNHQEKRQALDEFNIQAIWGASEKLKIRVDVPKQVWQQLGDDVFAEAASRWNGTCNN
jgi:aminoglycoside phosphotransferase (APT) family kinase protein